MKNVQFLLTFAVRRQIKAQSNFFLSICFYMLWVIVDWIYILEHDMRSQCIQCFAMLYLYDEAFRNSFSCPLTFETNKCFTQYPNYLRQWRNVQLCKETGKARINPKNYNVLARLLLMLVRDSLNWFKYIEIPKNAKMEYTNKGE